MALARWPARWGQLRSLVRTFHDLELGVRSFAGSAEAGVGAVGRLLGLRLVAAFVGGGDVLASAEVTLVGQDERPASARAR